MRKDKEEKLMTWNVIVIAMCIGITVATFLGGYLGINDYIPKFFRFIRYMFSSQTASDFYKKEKERKKIV